MSGWESGRAAPWLLRIAERDHAFQCRVDRSPFVERYGNRPEGHTLHNREKSVAPTAKEIECVLVLPRVPIHPVSRVILKYMRISLCCKMKVSNRC